jgi:hypothetical protein
MKWSSRVRQEAAIHAGEPYVTNAIRAIDKSQVDAWAASRNKALGTTLMLTSLERLVHLGFQHFLEHGLDQRPEQVGWSWAICLSSVMLMLCLLRFMDRFSLFDSFRLHGELP